MTAPSSKRRDTCIQSYDMLGTLYFPLRRALNRGSCQSCYHGAQRCFSSMVDSLETIETPAVMSHSSGNYPLTTHLSLDCCDTVVQAFQTITQDGISIAKYDMDMAVLRRIFETMVRLRAFDETFKLSQRQGRLSFFMESRGEEAAVVASAAALDGNDHIFSQYREHGALLWRGVSMEDMAHQCCGTRKDAGKGRQMPVHYGDKTRNFHTVSSPLATQLLHAVGFSYSLKLSQEKNITCCYFGEGAASEGDFHAALNFASTLECPVLFICRNNGWSISTSANEQYRGDGIVSRASGYGIASCRVDGGDARAVYLATRMAREYVLATGLPVLLELMSHRLGDHSTSDDCTRYMPRTLLEQGMKLGDPLVRLKRFLKIHGTQPCQGLEDDEDKDLFQRGVEEAREAIRRAEREPPLPPVSLFDDVYDHVTFNLQQQREEFLRLAMP